MNEQTPETEDDACANCGAPMWPVRFALYQRESTRTLDNLSKRLERLEQRIAFGARKPERRRDAELAAEYDRARGYDLPPADRPESRSEADHG